MPDMDPPGYFALSLTSLLPGRDDLVERLRDPQASLALLADMHPFVPAEILDHMFVRLNSLTNVQIRRAYFWLQRYLTDPKLQYFILQHPATTEHTFPSAIYNSMQAASGGNFYHQVEQYHNLRLREVEQAMEPLFTHMKVLSKVGSIPWWEAEYSLTRADIDTVIGYLRLALR